MVVKRTPRDRDLEPVSICSQHEQNRNIWSRKILRLAKLIVLSVGSQWLEYLWEIVLFIPTPKVVWDQLKVVYQSIIAPSINKGRIQIRPACYDAQATLLLFQCQKGVYVMDGDAAEI